MTGEIRILLFASAREAVGRRRLDWPVPAEGVPVHDVLSRLEHDHPALRTVLRASRVIVNGEPMKGPSRLLHAGDELAIHPPYSGG